MQEPATIIGSDEQLDSILREINRRMRERGASTPWRAIMGILDVASMIGEDLPYPVIERDPTAGVFTGEDLVLRIERWFRRRYGKRLEEHSGPGRMCVEIEGDVWAFRFPSYVFPQRLHLTCGPASKDLEMELASGGGIMLNVFDFVEDAPEQLAEDLTEEEANTVLEKFILGLSALERLSYFDDQVLFKQALADNDAAVHSLVGIPPNYANAKWAAHQATEKVLKGYLSAKQVSFPFTHNLSELATLSARAGGTASSEDLALVTSDPGIRYGEETVTLQSALAAHHASLRVARDVTSSLPLPELGLDLSEADYSDGELDND